MDLRTLPKIELHRHLEGSVRLSTVFDLSRQAGVSLPADTPEGLASYGLLREPVDGLEKALQSFSLAQNSIRTYDALRRITVEAIQDLAMDHVRLAELRFSPHFMCEPGRLDWDAAMEAILQGREQALAGGCDVTVGFIAIFSRDFGMDSAKATVDFAVRHIDDLVGFDVAGTELGYPPALYAKVLTPIRESGMGLTVHYGESGPATYPREAVEVLAPNRLGHGLSVAQDPDVTRLVIERGVTLEMCPTSNWLTQGVADVREHPVRKLLQQGVAVTLNTDDPELMGIDLTHEFEVARDTLGFTEDDFRAVTRDALAASFLPGRDKEAVRDRHFGWLERTRQAERTS